MTSPRKARKSKNFVFGIRTIMEAIEAGVEIEKILLQKGARSEQLRNLAMMGQRHNVPLQRVPSAKLTALTSKNHQGAIAFLSGIRYASLDHIVDASFAAGKDPVLLILDRITDVRNMGAIARTAECAGVDAMVIQHRGNAMITSDAMKTSAGALHHLPVCRVEDLAQTLKYVRESGIRVVAATEKGSLSLYNAELTGPVAVVLGSEENGIDPALLGKADETLRIPVNGHIQSLNVSVAAGIVLYEMLRQRNR